MLSEDKIMDVLEAFDLTRSYRSAAQLCGVDHHTVRRYVAAREAGLDPTSPATLVHHHHVGVVEPRHDLLVDRHEIGAGRLGSLRERTGSDGHPEVGAHG